MQSRTEQCAELYDALPSCAFVKSKGARDLPEDGWFRPDRSYTQLCLALDQLGLTHKTTFKGKTIEVDVRSPGILTRVKDTMEEVADVSCIFNSNWVLLRATLMHLKKM
jgi:hypothetical protein